MPEAPAPRDWRRDVLRALGAPPTRQNLEFLAAWQRFEGGHTANAARFNWLNTTQGSGFPSINSVGVRSYPDYRTGVAQTVGTLNNGRYRNLVAGLRSGAPLDPMLRPAVAGDLQTWVSGRRNGNPEYPQKIFGAAASGVPGGSGTGGGRDIGGIGYNRRGPAAPLPDVPNLGERAVDAAGNIPGVSTAVDIATAPYDAAKWLFGNWDRILEIMAGILLLAIGLILLGRSLIGTNVVGGAAGNLANRLQYGPTVVRASRDSSLSKPTLTEDTMARSRRPSSGYDPASADIPY